ncbi:TIGR04222 domain-containing membrane protein [Saccharothrix yanglingensis]|nr:TIGR04222 domain-containing membrane protein [Saccharothrix yanglingensis]
MASSWTPTSAGTAGSTPELRPEEQAFLAGGPGRAAEVAVVSLVEAGAVRVSRGGLVSAVRLPGRAWSPLQANVLHALPQPLGGVIGQAAGSAEARALREQLVSRGFITSPRRRSAWSAVRLVGFAVFVGSLFAVGFAGWSVALPVLLVPLLVVLTVVAALARRPLTRAGRRAVRRLRRGVTTSDRLGLVACHGLLGRAHGRVVWSDWLGIAPAAGATLRRRPRRRGSSGSSGSSGAGGCGSGCGSCGSSCGGGGSSSGSSCGGGSSSSSCGGGGGGCGGGGGD